MLGLKTYDIAHSSLLSFAVISSVNWCADIELQWSKFSFFTSVEKFNLLCVILTVWCDWNNVSAFSGSDSKAELKKKRAPCHPGGWYVAQPCYLSVPPVLLYS